ncbi:Ribonuclease H [Hyphodiscus hymeniophilus]|uniref:Ribonuclease H n=1 Tax=Hyphodiscus hymeniophilus TaxID=353542 RepID=A0A9P7AVW5_9HELO|nr:Ribonuclease H [Hyphodiscus hymeniophilus]
MSTAGKKRKSSEISETKYYAVRAGKTPGVYTTWEECQNNTFGFKGAAYKSFTNEQEARDFVAGKVNRRALKSTGDKFYGVAVGHHPGVYEDWADASEEIKGVKGPKYKKFATKAEAEEFVRTGGKSSTVLKADAEGPKAKKAKTGVESASSRPVNSSKVKTVVVHTDGSSRGNGRQGAFAGVGVYFGEDDPRNVSERLEGDLQTNQRAELTAVQRALEIVPKGKNIQIVTDSNYTINCCEVWYKGWQKNGWKTSNGGPVLNKDLVVTIRDLIDERDENGAVTSFEWIKGHSGNLGNVAADTLAVAGAFKRR